MTLVGSQLGQFAIVGPIGSGAMGDVYRARDTRLGRDVALKILPAAFAQDQDRRVRFEREARLLAALHHPHIATIFGVEDAGGSAALVMELVEGPTLAERLDGQRPRAKGCPSPRRSRSRVNSPRRSTPRTRRGSSIATSSQPTSR